MLVSGIRLAGVRSGRGCGAFEVGLDELRCDFRDDGVACTLKESRADRPALSHAVGNDISQRENFGLS